MIRILVRIGLGAALVVLAMAAVLVGHVRGSFVSDRSPAELDALIAPHDEVFRPDGGGPFPAVVFFHGCGGLRDSLRQWAEQLRDAGVLVVATNSYAGRGLAWQEVCNGRKLLGRERAGDVWVSFDRVRRRPDVDPQRVALMGWSHGSWAVMELFALEPGALPPGLDASPPTPPGEVAGIVLLYPYCGFGSAAASGDWPHAPDTLLLLAEQDSITAAAECVAWAEGRAGVAAHVYPGVDHGFDQAIPTGEWPSTFDEAAGGDARVRVLAFLSERFGLRP